MVSRRVFELCFGLLGGWGEGRGVGAGCCEESWGVRFFDFGRDWIVMCGSRGDRNNSFLLLVGCCSDLVVKELSAVSFHRWVEVLIARRESWYALHDSEEGQMHDSRDIWQVYDL